MPTRTPAAPLVLVAVSALLSAAGQSELQNRRQRAADAFRDGILLVHARSAPEPSSDGFRQDPAFYYFTGLENTTGAILAIDGRSRQSWLFLPTRALYSRTLPPEGSSGSDAVKTAGIEHVADWSELESFLSRAAIPSRRLYYIAPEVSLAELPPNITGVPESKAPEGPQGWWNPRETPSWVIIISKRWPSFLLSEAADRVFALTDVQSSSEMVELRAAANATVQAVMTGIRTIRPGITQRRVEEAIVNACRNAGARTSWWQWAMSGANGIYPRPNAADVRYDRLNTVMKSGDLVRLDAGCEWNHYEGDLGRTIPVSGRFSDEQREIWNIFVAAYHAGARSLRAGATTDKVFDAWRAELLLHRSAKSPLAKQAVEKWSRRENVPDWEIHTMNPISGDVQNPFRAGTTIAFEPIASIGGQGYYLEDMFLVTKAGAELLTPGVPYSAEEIEGAMNVTPRKSPK